MLWQLLNREQIIPKFCTAIISQNSNC